ncbi:hypothetical protein Tco_0789586 [Tanacetum coccineum]
MAPTTLEGVNARVTELTQVQEEETQDIYVVIEDAQDRQTHISERNNIPPKRTSTAAVVALITAAAVEKLIKARVSAALANHETLQNSIDGYGDGSHNSDTRIRGIGTKGVVVLSQWFEKMESMFHISNCAMENQVKFATCTFLGNALTWWNSHMKTVTQDVAYAMD